MTDAGHQRSIVVWDVPAAAVSGEVFSFKAGIKCAADCRPDGWEIELRNDRGTRVATTTVGDEPWQGTAALYPAVFELRAPDAEGMYGFEVFAPGMDASRSGGEDAGWRHNGASARFNLRTVPESECRLTVLALDRATRQPVPGLKVVAHPYRSLTDERGVAELQLPKGRYRLFVSGKDFLPLRLDGEITADQEIRAELTVDRGPTDAELWS